ncbi:MAG: type II toxin-antitoxin system VapC family toxin, partial [Microbacterium sp.]
MIDTSGIVEWLLGRAGGKAVADLMADSEVTLHAPSILGIEVASALRGLVLSGQMDPERGSQAIADLMAIDVALHDTTV